MSILEILNKSFPEKIIGNVYMIKSIKLSVILFFEFQQRLKND